jgi:hypothetical protein
MREVPEIFKKFMLIESSQIPLTEINYEEVKQTIIDPTTGKPYKGIVLEGVFADLSNNSPNNNKRFYDIPTYLQLIQILRKQIFSPKGVYGELEHPEGYSVNSNNVSHKLLDVWYNESEQKVYGRILLLNRGNGLIAQEIIKSGGQLAISARAAGEEKKNPDGTFSCKVKLMTTFDLVYHPGFSTAVLNFKELNESQKFLTEVGNNKTGFSTIIYEDEIKNINNKYLEYISLNENQRYCFYEWLNLNEAASEEKRIDWSRKKDEPVSKEDKEKNKNDEKKLEKNEPSDQQQYENKLTSEVDELKQCFINQLDNSQQKLKRKISKQGNSFYDNSAGFIDNVSEDEDFVKGGKINFQNNYFIGIDNNGFTY